MKTRMCLSCQKWFAPVGYNDMNCGNCFIKNERIKMNLNTFWNDFYAELV